MFGSDQQRLIEPDVEVAISPHLTSSSFARQ